MIEITGVDLNKFVQEIYALSAPFGMGFVHYRKGALSDEDAQGIIDREPEGSGIAVRMDYVHGRGCKMTVFRKQPGVLEIPDNWYDHSPEQLDELLTRCKVKRP